MIGVIADAGKEAVVCEFFELFKTPWEFYRENRRYDVLLCAGDGEFEGRSNLVVVYAGRKTPFDRGNNLQSYGRRKSARTLSYHGVHIPIYGEIVTFPGIGDGFLKHEDSQELAAYLDRPKSGTVVRVGYDLFDEVRTLLEVGQPPAEAHLPTLEMHIALLRDLITGCGLPLVEIPPVPDGYRFMACLTHDVDHPSVRQHKFDHTAFGFLYRAVFGSVANLLRGRQAVGDLLMNWVAVMKLPLVHLGVLKDFWLDFDRRYAQLDGDCHSTFFVIPFKNRTGKNFHGLAPAFRAAHYGALDLADVIRRLVANGCEIGLHGIDAWLESSMGREELEEIRRVSGTSEMGVRMHWLYYDQRSPAVLESAGAAYDSTVGFNETVGYRAGTTQVYRPLHTHHLLELPMHVMDTALFSPDHLGLSRQQAKILLRQMMDTVVETGGCLTINWHDRSTAPERLWEAPYRDLIEGLKSRGAWFPTAGQAVCWFRKRRSAAFEMDPQYPGLVRAKILGDHGDNLPRLRLRIHRAQGTSATDTHASESYVDLPIDESANAYACVT